MSFCTYFVTLKEFSKRKYEHSKIVCACSNKYSKLVFINKFNIRLSCGSAFIKVVEFETSMFYLTIYIILVHLL